MCISFVISFINICFYLTSWSNGQLVQIGNKTIYLNKDIYSMDITSFIATNTTPEEGKINEPSVFGVCYSPMHNKEYPLHGDISMLSNLRAAMVKDFQLMRQYTTVVRTFYSSYYGISVASIAAETGMQLYLGVFVTDEIWYEEQVNYAIDAIKQYPNTIRAILVGNENLIPYGKYSIRYLLDKINIIKKRIKEEISVKSSLYVKIGTVQRLTEWIHEDPFIKNEIKILADNIDIIGVNIYPFFDPSFSLFNNPSSLLDISWNEMISRYPVDKIRLTETGFPTDGSITINLPRNIPNIKNAKAYYDSFIEWQKNNLYKLTGPSFWFAFYDRRPDDNTMADDVEKHFGFFTHQREKKLNDFPILLTSSTNSPVPTSTLPFCKPKGPTYTWIHA